MTPPDAPAITQPAPAAPDRHTLRFGFDNTYARLPERFYARVNPTPVAAPRLIHLNADLARILNLDPEALATSEGIEVLAGNSIAPGSEPLAQAYAGHQFGQFVPQLGDGRANLLGELIARDGRRYDIQLKGSGPTPFSRRGDGRAALGPVLREYLVSEAMAALGVPTTRALAAVTTGQQVVRETLQPGSIFTRVAASHLRVGTFQYFAARGDTEAIRILADYAIARHYPEITSPEITSPKAHQPYRAFLDAVIARQAHLIAQWMLLGFIHGVMNTDNMSISGESIDFGPCAFMEAYDPATVFSSIDVAGRYAYSNQPPIALWNLTRLAESLLPILEVEAGSKGAALDSAKESLATFQTQFEAALLAGFRRKLGLTTPHESDPRLIAELLDRMAANQADFTLTFSRLCAAATSSEPDSAIRALFADPAAYDTWAAQWRLRLAREPIPAPERAAAMRLVNPTFIPRNHLVEAAIVAAVTRDDLQPFHQLLDVVTHPFNNLDDSPGTRPDLARYTLPARPEEAITQTFCGT